MWIRNDHGYNQTNMYPTMSIMWRVNVYDVLN